MTVMYSRGTSTYTKQHTLTVVASDTNAVVVKANGQPDHNMIRRLERLAKRGPAPTSAEEWIRLFGKNLSTISLSAPQPAETVEQAITEAAQ